MPPTCILRLYAAASLKRRVEADSLDYLACILRLYAAASLKRTACSYRQPTPSSCILRLYAAASLKPGKAAFAYAACCWYSAALCRGLIEARTGSSRRCRRSRYSAALCRGLIEATSTPSTRPSASRYSAALCRGLIEAAKAGSGLSSTWRVFCGFMPRPH